MNYNNLDFPPFFCELLYFIKKRYMYGPKETMKFLSQLKVEKITARC